MSDLTISSNFNTPATLERVRAVADKFAGRSAEGSTVVEGNADELREKAVRAEFHRLWKRHDTDLSAHSAKAKALAGTQQDNIRSFLVEAYPQALELIKPENREFLNNLIQDIMDETPKPTENGLFIQIAALQIGKKNKDGEFKTPARREERYGLLYRIFAGKGWTPEGLDGNIKLKGGTTAIIAQDAADRDKASGIVAKREQYAKDAYGKPDGAPSVRVEGADPKNGKWRLALVSVHDDSTVHVHGFVGQADDGATKRAVKDYADGGLVSGAVAAEPNTLPVVYEEARADDGPTVSQAPSELAAA